MEETFITDPPPPRLASRIRTQTCFDTSQGPVRFVLKTLSHSSSDRSRLDLTLPLIPALLIKTSMFPKMSQACLTAFWMVDESEETSSSRGAACLVFVGENKALISEQRDWRRSRRRAAAMILQPDLARSRQISLPMPEEAPVRRTTLSLSSHHGSSCFITCFLDQ